MAWTISQPYKRGVVIYTGSHPVLHPVRTHFALASMTTQSAGQQRFDLKTSQNEESCHIKWLKMQSLLQLNKSGDLTRQWP